MDINQQIGLKLKKLRESRNLSLADVAQRLNKSRSSIHAYEVGRISISVDVLIELCNLYDVNYAKMLQEIVDSK